ncbi:ankyrin repeat domain-containing protein [Aspergillus mulundensis]|uniref:F-box domain-containing protein n=1 Tax=Aspergillus mulundensis TaxID=1810919 RepID=A0A3D8S5J3_9EURO|nr:hypothetical protein DSM5745_04841 [Aspergillus mulundensis]RDW81284.1 hypothetical protein DSM5745_04841 [Aspergillus mulundensis]
MTPTSLLTLPPELQLTIVENIDSPRYLNALSQTCKQLYPIITPILYGDEIKNNYSGALFWAARNNSPGTIERMLSHGASVDSEDGHSPASAMITKIRHHPTALMYAASNGHIESARTLLKHGADAYKYTRNDYGAGRGPALVEAAKGGMKPMNALEAAIVEGHSHTVQALLNHGADIERIALHSPLITAVVAGNISAITVLLVNGAKIDAAYCYDANTALVSAINARQIEIVRLLLHWGANVHEGYPSDFTPLEAAEGQMNMIKLLVRYGADPARLSEADRERLEAEKAKEAARWEEHH